MTVGISELCREHGLIGGRYEVLEKLGAGGMGWVVSARDHQFDGQMVALKFLYPHLLHNESSFGRFRNEVLVARKLSHPNIVRTYNIGLTAEHAFIVMEHVAGTTLKARLVAEYPGGMPVAPAIAVIMRICFALMHAHGTGIVHRDVKPDNVLCTATGDVKMSDFGLAATLRRQGHLTRIGQVIGSPYYMPPEQFAGHPADVRSDIYSLGVLLYELLCGTVPFSDASLFGLAQLHLAAPLPSREVFRSAPYDELWNVIVRCTKKDSAERYPSVEALLADLRRCSAVTSLPDLITLSESPLARDGEDREPPLAEERRIRLTAAQLVYATLVILGVLGFWTRHNDSLQSRAGVVILLSERALGTRLGLLRGALNVYVPSPPVALAAAMRRGKQALFARLWAGDDPNDPQNIERHYPEDPSSTITLHNYAIVYAVQLRDGDSLRMLLEAHANPNVVDSAGKTPLVYAVELNELPLVDALLAHGASPNFPAVPRDRPLNIAVARAVAPGLNTIAGHLIDQGGADPLLRDRSGRDAITVAVESGANLPLIELLLNRMRALRKRPSDAAMSAASRSQRPELVRLFESY